MRTMAPNAAGPQDHDGSQPGELLPEEVREIGQQAGIVVGKHAVDRAANAKMVADTIERVTPGRSRRPRRSRTS